MPELAALYEHCIFESRERSATHSLVTRELSHHRLRWHRGAADTRMCKFDTPGLSLYSLRYGAEVEIHPVPYDGFSLVHFSLSGGIEIEADGQCQPVRQGRAIVSSPRRRIDLHWSGASEQLILRLPHRVLEGAAGRLGQPHLYNAIRRTPGLLLTEAASGQWLAQLQAFTALEKHARESEAHRPWLEHMEYGLAMFLLLQAGPTVAATDDGDRPKARQARRRLDRLHGFALSHLSLPVTLADLASAAALSERQLNVLCHEHLGMSPMAWLRGLRLDAVRAALLADPHCDLAGIAMLHGFHHLGRFSAHYRARFGELPRETRRSARSG